MKVLVISYYFPPMGGPGVQRVLKFIKYLVKSSVDVKVFTVAETLYYAYDEELLRELPGNVEVIRSESYDPFRLLRRGGRVGEWSGLPPSWFYMIYHQFFIPDTRIGWLYPAWKKLREVIKSYKPDIVFSTAPPFTSLILAYRARRAFGIPVIMDLRDPWSTFHFKHYIFPFQRKLDIRLERKTLLGADKVVVVAPGLKEELEGRIEELRGKVEFIPNGYDPDDFNVEPVEFDRFTILHLGTLYGGENAPEPVFKAIGELLRESPSLGKELRFIIVGRVEPGVLELIEKYDLTSIVDKKGYLTHSEAIRHLLGAHLVLFIHRFRGEERGMMVPQRVFEFMAAERPVLDVGDQSSYASWLLRQAGISCGVSFDDVEGIKRGIVAIKEDEFKIEPKREFIEEFSRPYLTRKLRKIMEEVIRRGGP